MWQHPLWFELGNSSLRSRVDLETPHRLTSFGVAMGATIHPIASVAKSTKTINLAALEGFRKIMYKVAKSSSVIEEGMKTLTRH